MYQPPICKNDRCSNIVPPSKNPGKKRLFCSNRCARRYHARLSYQREVGKDGGNLVFVNEKGQAQVNRRIALTAKAAEYRYKSHLVSCALHGGPCPGRLDPYGRRRLCIIASVFADDWTQMRCAEEGRPIRRYSTTADGRWISDLTPEERAAIESRPAWPDTKGGYITPETRRFALDAGAGASVTPKDKDIARYNEGLPGQLPLPL